MDKNTPVRVKVTHNKNFNHGGKILGKGGEYTLPVNQAVALKNENKVEILDTVPEELLNPNQEDTNVRNLLEKREFLRMVEANADEMLDIFDAAFERRKEREEFARRSRENSGLSQEDLDKVPPSRTIPQTEPGTVADGQQGSNVQALGEPGGQQETDENEADTNSGGENLGGTQTGGNNTNTDTTSERGSSNGEGANIPANKQKTGTPLPEGFTANKMLEEAGITTYEEIPETKEALMKKVPEMTERTANQIGSRVAQWKESQNR